MKSAVILAYLGNCKKLNEHSNLFGKFNQFMKASLRRAHRVWLSEEAWKVYPWKV